MGICFCASRQNINGEFHLFHSREATDTQIDGKDIMLSSPVILVVLVWLFIMKGQMVCLYE